MVRLSRRAGLLIVALTAILVIPTAAAIATLGLPTAVTHAAPSGPHLAAAELSAAPGLLARTLAAEKAYHIPSTALFLPNLNARISNANGIVSPLYTAAPAPMGLGDFGITASGGVNVGTISYTRSVEASVTLNSVDPFYLASSSPDIFTMQLNTVLVHVNVLGNHYGSYWIQNVPVYYASSQTLAFEDNIWNFTAAGAGMQTSTLFSDGGTLVPGVFYYAIGPSFHMPTPFTVRLYNNATVPSNRPTQFFNYSITTSNGTVISGSYDEVMFNASANPHPGFPGRPTYQINGVHTNAIGLLNDAEIMIGGPGGGSTTTLFGINATMGLWTLANTSNKYAVVPGAFDYGTDTGETSEGIAEWASTGGTPMAVLGEGPSLLYPLWGVVGAATSTLTTSITLSPSNAWIFASMTSGFNTSKAAWAPSNPSGVTTITLPAGTYSYEFLLSDYKPVFKTVSGSGTASWAVPLTANTAYGVYTPLWAWNDGQLAAISQPGGLGTPAHPFVLVNNAVGPLSPLFGEFNDFYYPVFTGVFLGNVNVTTDIYRAPSFDVNYVLPSEALASAFFGTPFSNNLGMQVWNSSHVSIVSTVQITGWFFNGNAYMSNILFWNTSDSLIAGNAFQVQSAGIIVSGGGHNVIWGNTFTAATTTAANPAEIQYGTNNIAVQSFESSDLIYNNVFSTPVPAYTPNFNLYTGAPTIYADRWNVSLQPASDVRTINGWHLSGNILGLSWEGGNFWSGYGQPGNPYGVLPFNDFGLITVGGDQHPLLTFTLHRIVFKEAGLTAGDSWSVTINGYTQTVLAGTAITFWEPSGLYAYAVGVPATFTAHPAIGAVSLGSTVVHVHIHIT
ncbi:MAG: thermopsin family protease [Thermoplasmata archaeon]|nr:thermopsin family protease [Thermoplasmata archaeon]